MLHSIVNAVLEKILDLVLEKPLDLILQENPHQLQYEMEVPVQLKLPIPYLFDKSKHKAICGMVDDTGAEHKCIIYKDVRVSFFKHHMCPGAFSERELRVSNNRHTLVDYIRSNRVILIPKLSKKTPDVIDYKLIISRHFSDDQLKDLCDNYILVELKDVFYNKRNVVTSGTEANPFMDSYVCAVCDGESLVNSITSSRYDGPVNSRASSQCKIMPPVGDGAISTYKLKFACNVFAIAFCRRDKKDLRKYEGDYYGPGTMLKMCIFSTVKVLDDEGRPNFGQGSGYINLKSVTSIVAPFFVSNDSDTGAVKSNVEQTMLFPRRLIGIKEDQFYNLLNYSEAVICVYKKAEDISSFDNDTFFTEASLIQFFTREYITNRGQYKPDAGGNVKCINIDNYTASI